MRKAALNTQERTICDKIGAIVLLINWDVLPRVRFEKLMGECSYLYSNTTAQGEEILAALRKVRAELESGAYLPYARRLITNAREFQNFWAHIGHIHAESAHNEGYDMFRAKFPQNLCLSTELLAWLQKKHTTVGWLWWYLCICHRQEYYNELVGFKKDLADRKIKFRVTGRMHTNTCRRAAYWRNFSEARFNICLPRDHIASDDYVQRLPKTIQAVREQDSAPAREQDSAPARKRDNSPTRKLDSVPDEQTAREWLDEFKFSARIDITYTFQERDSSPRPCRCGAVECWCFDKPADNS